MAAAAGFSRTPLKLSHAGNRMPPATGTVGLRVRTGRDHSVLRTATMDSERLKGLTSRNGRLDIIKHAVKIGRE